MTPTPTHTALTAGRTTMAQVTEQDWRTMPAGRALDALVCQRHGIPGRVRYYASSDDGESGWTFSDVRREVEAAVVDTNARFPNSHYANSTVHEVTHYPQVSTDIAAAWQVVERMRPTHRFELHDRGGDRPFVARFGHALESAPTPALAICRAALAAGEVGS